MANKVRFGLAKVKYALWTPGVGNAEGSYGQLKDFPGAVSLTTTREGGDSSDFYADDGVYYTFAGTNGGYSADLEMARITDQVRVDLLGEVLDEGTGIQFETTQAEPAQFALVFETQGDQGPVGFVYYNCKASRAELSANTKGESPEVDTDTLNLRIAANEFTHLGEKKSFVQGHIEKTSTNANKYNAFFASVVKPTATQG